MNFLTYFTYLIFLILLCEYESISLLSNIKDPLGKQKIAIFSDVLKRFNEISSSYESVNILKPIKFATTANDIKFSDSTQISEHLLKELSHNLTTDSSSSIVTPLVPEDKPENNTNYTKSSDNLDITAFPLLSDDKPNISINSSKTSDNSNMTTSDQIFSNKSSDIAVMSQEILTVYGNNSLSSMNITVIPSTLDQTILGTDQPICEDSVNFNDPYVECLSAGTESSAFFASDETIFKAQLLYTTNRKELNFNDNITDCLSEGSSWNIPIRTIPIIKEIPNIIQADKTFENGLKSELKNDNEIFEKIKEKLEFLLTILTIDQSAIGLVQLCDMIENSTKYDDIDRWIMKNKRSNILIHLLQNNYRNYVEIVSFLSNRIPRNELPNVQDIPYPQKDSILDETVTSSKMGNKVETKINISVNGTYISSCKLPKLKYEESKLDEIFLSMYRNNIRKEMKYRSNLPGMKGLIDESRFYMLSQQGKPNYKKNQHAISKSSLSSIFSSITPNYDSFYRLLFSGILPNVDNDPEWFVNAFQSFQDSLPYKIRKFWLPGKQFGPYPYAPYLTSIIAPKFLNFFVGPSHSNRRKDGKLGGILVEKCKFLQESNCKGMCLHQCKIPTQQLFSSNLGIPLSITPNYETHECQWSWGESPVDLTNNPAFPKGCIDSCDSKVGLNKDVYNDKINICNS